MLMCGLKDAPAPVHDFVVWSSPMKGFCLSFRGYIARVKIIIPMRGLQIMFLVQGSSSGLTLDHSRAERLHVPYRIP